MYTFVTQRGSLKSSMENDSPPTPWLCMGEMMTPYKAREIARMLSQPQYQRYWQLRLTKSDWFLFSFL